MSMHIPNSAGYSTLSTRAEAITFTPAQSTTYVRIVFGEQTFASSDELAGVARELKQLFGEDCTVAMVSDGSTRYALSVTPAQGDIFNAQQRRRLLQIALGDAARAADATFSIR